MRSGTAQDLAYGVDNSNAPPYDLKPSHGPTLCTVATPLCSAAAYDTMLLSITLWAALQLTWTSILLVTQVWQVGRQMTTMEVSNLGKYGFMGGRGGQSLRDQSGAMRQATAIGAGVGPSGAGEEGVPPMDPHSECDHGRGKHRHGIGACCGKLCAPVLQVLGLDRFTKGKAVSGMARAGRGQNPFDLGVRRVRLLSPAKLTPELHRVLECRCRLYPAVRAASRR